MEILELQPGQGQTWQSLAQGLKMGLSDCKKFLMSALTLSTFLLIVPYTSKFLVSCHHVHVLGVQVAGLGLPLSAQILVPAGADWVLSWHALCQMLLCAGPVSRSRQPWVLVRVTDQRYPQKKQGRGREGSK